MNALHFMRGRCHACAVTYHWYGPPLLPRAVCTRCGSQLRFGRQRMAGRHVFEAPGERPRRRAPASKVLS